MTLTIINAIANLISAIALSGFIVFAFGRRSLLYTRPTAEWLLVKVGLSFMAAGTLFNFFTLAETCWTQVMLNVGLAITFVWAAIFHYNHFIRKSKKG